MTLVGPDHVGIVDRVTKKILEFHGNIEESRMARLGGDFSMLLLISVTEDKREALIEELQSIADRNITAVGKVKENSFSGQLELSASVIVLK